MRVRIVSAYYCLRNEEEFYAAYADKLRSVAPISFYSELDSGNSNMEMDLESFDQLIELSKAVDRDLLLSRPYGVKSMYEIWINDYYME